jgi:hypothetical protein
MRNGNAGKHIHNLAWLKSLNVGNIIGELKTFTHEYVAGSAVEVGD